MAMKKECPDMDKSKAGLRIIAIHNHLNSLFTAQGTNLAEQVEAGTLSIPNGVIYRKQG